MFGLDRFEALSASLGLVMADRLLVEIAHRLNASLRATDVVSTTLARLAGDEFAVLIEDIADANDAPRVGERLRLTLEKPFEVDGRQVFTSASAGVAVSSTGYTARRRSCATRRSRCIAPRRSSRAARSSTPPCGAAPRAASRWKAPCARPSRIGAFEVHYQPIVEIESGCIVGVEALARWQHPERGLVSAGEFIAIAEDTAMIFPLGRLILEASCRQMIAWQRQFGAAAPNVVCVNVSSRQFADVELSSHIEATLRDTGLEPSRLKLEITESAFLGDLQAARYTLQRMQAMGVKWSLDDFGTGYSSLSHLHRLKVDTVKIDRSFVSRIAAKDNGSEVVRAIVALAHNLEMDVVAEGVETVQQLEYLRTLGCEHAQGFFFSKPVTAAAAERLIERQPWTGDALATKLAS